tara:strand:- start:752 stop:1180 length:429 start_codon:yes stop_codon:yes gene_type:complete
MSVRVFSAAAALGMFVVVGIGHIGSAKAQSVSTPTPAEVTGATRYDEKLLRLAEILGSLQYLRNLCGESGESVWRETMEKLLGAEAPDDELRHERLTAGYNRGYRTFASVYTSCSDAAVEAEARYRGEGESLTADIVARYGN